MFKFVIGILFISSGLLFALGTSNLESACDNGIATACHELAILNEKGFGVDKNITKATDLYKKACDLGFDTVCSKIELTDNNVTKIKD